MQIPLMQNVFEIFNEHSYGAKHAWNIIDDILDYLDLTETDFMKNSYCQQDAQYTKKERKNK